MTSEQIQVGDEIEATFRPKDLSTLRDRAKPLIGQRLRWQALWAINGEDGGPYVGQWAWEPIDVEPWVGWVPSEDLEIVGRAGGTE